jgi:hypothetical protein
VNGRQFIAARTSVVPRTDLVVFTHGTCRRPEPVGEGRHRVFAAAISIARVRGRRIIFCGWRFVESKPRLARLQEEDGERDTR